MRVWKSYAWVVLGGAGFAALIHIGSLIGFVLEPQRYYFRAWEWFSDFAYRSEEFSGSWDGVAQGDLANRYLFLYDQSRRVRVRTDEFGFRQSYLPADHYELAIAGDSTIWGSGLSDEETLPYLLSKKLGRPVFNASTTTLDNALGHPAMRGVKIVVDGRAERNIRAPFFWPIAPSTEGFRPLASGKHSRWATYRRVSAERYSFVARLPVYFRRAREDLRALLSGKANAPYLFLEHRYTQAQLAEVVPILVTRHRKLAARGIRYIFLPVPAKQTLYKSDVDATTRNFLGELHTALRAGGVEMVNLLPAYQQHKAKGLFQRYDTHWNARGTELAAQVLADHLSERD